MASSEKLYTISPSTRIALRSFRLSTSRAKEAQAVIYSINKTSLEIAPEETEEEDEEGDGVGGGAKKQKVYSDIPALGDELPPNQPRFVLLSYPMVLPSGRLSVPYVMIYYMPLNCSNEIRMLYAGAKELLRSTAEAGKVIEISDGEELEGIEALLGGGSEE